MRVSESSDAVISCRVKTHYHGIKHHDKMNPHVEMFGIEFTTQFATGLKNFRLVKQFNYLDIERLSAKMTTSVHR